MSYQNPIPNLGDSIDAVMFESESDYTHMEEIYFAFIDVLGFKKTFDDIKISQKTDSAEKYRDVFNYYFALMNVAKFMENSKSNICYAGQTSDSLYFYTDRTDYLMQFIKIFSHFNLYAMSKDVFFRGGVAKGKLYKKEMYQFYGDSVISAFLLESNISKNPIIMVDERTNTDMSDTSGYKDVIAEINRRHYIKPFKYLREGITLDIDESFVVREIDEKLIVENIEKNKRAFEYDTNNHSKYIFLGDEIKKVINV